MLIKDLKKIITNIETTFGEAYADLSLTPSGDPLLNFYTITNDKILTLDIWDDITKYDAAKRMKAIN